jgi:hypothetical protein
MTMITNSSQPNGLNIHATYLLSGYLKEIRPIVENNPENPIDIKRYIIVIITYTSKLANVADCRSLPVAARSFADTTDTTLEVSIKYIN